MISKNDNDPKSFNIFYSAFYTLYPVVYNMLINNSGALLEEEDSDENYFFRYLETKNKISLIYLFRKNLIRYDLLVQYIKTYYYEAWKKYCRDVCRALSKDQNIISKLENYTLDDFLKQQKMYFTPENKKKFKFFFLQVNQLEIRMEKFKQKTLKNIKVIEYDSLCELNLKLLKIPIIYKESSSNLGLVIIDSSNMLENLSINLTDEKSIVFPINISNRKSLTSNANNINNAKNINDSTYLKAKKSGYSRLFLQIYQFLYFYQKNLGFNLLNLIWDYERQSFFNQINYYRKKNNQNFIDLENQNNLNAKFHYFTNSECLVYKIPIKPLIGIQLIPTESLYSSDRGSGLFGVAYMNDTKSLAISVFRIEKDCNLVNIQEFSEKLIIKKINNKKSVEIENLPDNNMDLLDNQNEI